ncbi:MAG TPA: J domain-containing protein [Patescibacteria group bacterium]|nr:J domain-containing protein [Patescibacteria group bacterium]
MPVVTHYDTLKVTRDAPPEVIQAVYKALAQKYHPDKNLNNPEAVRMMQMVIASYKVLADDAKRAEHDAWITQQIPPAPKRTLSPAEKAAEEKYRTYADSAEKWAKYAAMTEGDARSLREKAERAAQQCASCPPAEREKWKAWSDKADADAKAAEQKATEAHNTARMAATEAAKHAVASKDGQLVTLYDTLKITRDAPIEAIQAAAKAMAAKFPHDAANITAAGETLSDPQKKAQHDAWIRQKDPGAATPAARKSTAEELEARARADKAQKEAQAMSAWADQADEKAHEAEAKYAEAAETAKAKAATKDAAAWKTWAEKALKEAQTERARANQAAQKAAEARAKAEAAAREVRSTASAAERDEAMWSSTTNRATD